MEKDIWLVLDKIPLRCLYDEIPCLLWKRMTLQNSSLTICLAVEYGRILGKREERARRAKIA